MKSPRDRDFLELRWGVCEGRTSWAFGDLRLQLEDGVKTSYAHGKVDGVLLDGFFYFSAKIAR